MSAAPGGSRLESRSGRRDDLGGVEAELVKRGRWRLSWKRGARWRKLAPQDERLTGDAGSSKHRYDARKLGLKAFYRMGTGLDSTKVHF